MLLLQTLDRKKIKDVKQIVSSLLELSSASIIQNNFIKAFYANTNNGFLKGNFTLFGAKSMRITSQGPNLANLPATASKYAKPVKQTLVAPKGYVIYQVDLEALEDRVIANLSKDKNKLAIFLQDIDGHTLNSVYYIRNTWYSLFPKLENENDGDYAKRIYAEIEKGNKEFKKLRQMYKSTTLN